MHLTSELTDVFERSEKIWMERRTWFGVKSFNSLVCPTIEQIKEIDDPLKAPDLKSYDDLNLVDFVVLPHFNEKNKKKYEEIIKKYDKLKFVTLNDNQVIIVDESGYEVKG